MGPAPASLEGLETGEQHKPAGRVDVYVSLHDQFGDALKSLGVFRFEIFAYRPLHADPRGQRFEIDGVQEIDLREIAGNQAHWDKITQCYHIRLQRPDLPKKTSRIVLEVTFLPVNGGRLGDMLIIETKK